jgi:hypothetical protein
VYTSPINDKKESTSIFSKDESTNSSCGQPLFPYNEYYNDENLSENKSL